MHSKVCKQCHKEFTIYDEDLEFYAKFEVPEPNQCPDCRLVRRFLERNAKHLYYRTCSLTGQKTLSQYHQDQPFPVYSPSAWWGDGWDATTYGQVVDFNRPFFEQFLELKKKVPHMALFCTEGTLQNSEFNNCVAYLKNCYMTAESDYCEDCYYSNLIKKCTNMVDCSVCYECELCYECVGCTNCYALRYSLDCEQCKDSYFLQNCTACADCIGCINQRHKQYMVFNKQYSREEYEKIKQAFQLDTRNGAESLAKQCREFFIPQPHKAVFAEQNQNSIGDHLFNSKNAFYCFGSRDLEDCRYCAKLTLGVKSSMDYNSWGSQSELMYQCSGCGDNCYNLKFCVMCNSNVRDCEYCYECFSSNDCFGCIGLKRKKFCILNKQYSESEYRDLKRRLIAHMKKEGEYGEFFPINIGGFSYNESIAMDIYPLSKEETLARGYRWRDEDVQTSTQESKSSEVLHCTCGKSFKIIPQELKFYRQLSIPIPSLCPSCRHIPRMLRRNPPKLWQRACSNCHQEILTSYAPDRPETVYCERCYLETVY
ncbi:MAG: hypothetical protein AAB588_05735 [Patescibacteria group bacterium]